jgi:hypothetical protein
MTKDERLKEKYDGKIITMTAIDLYEKIKQAHMDGAKSALLLAMKILDEYPAKEARHEISKLYHGKT